VSLCDYGCELFFGCFAGFCCAIFSFSNCVLQVTFYSISVRV